MANEDETTIAVRVGMLERDMLESKESLKDMRHQMDMSKENEIAKALEISKLSQLIGQLSITMTELSGTVKAQGVLLTTNSSELAQIRSDLKWMGKIGMFFVPIFVGVCVGIFNIIIPKAIGLFQLAQSVHK